MADIRARLLPQLLWVLGTVTFATTAHGQTLFARPDTTPNYSSYRHVEECLTVIFRIAEAERRKGLTVWADTLLISEWKRLEKEKKTVRWDMMTPWPESAVEPGKVCLNRFNADTATFQSVDYGAMILQALLMTNRDQDAQRFTQRFVEMMRVRSRKDHEDAWFSVLATYIRTGPVRFAEAKQYYPKALDAVKGDSLYRTVDIHLLMASAARAVGDSAMYKEMLWSAIYANDSTPVPERLGSPGASLRLGALLHSIGLLTQEEGLDSLTISTLAYNMYRANTVTRRIEGGEVAVATDERVKPYKVPDLLGENSYTATAGASPDPSGQGLAAYTKEGAVKPGTYPIKNRINFITAAPSFCHAESTRREIDERAKSGGNSCLTLGTMFRRYKEAVPDIEIILLTDTYGHVGQRGPLKPADEADTLAKLFLGHYRSPAHLVVETTQFFHVEEPDGRRVDLPTPQMEELGPLREFYKLYWYTDKEGYRVSMFDQPWSSWFKRAYEILKNRPSK